MSAELLAQFPALATLAPAALRLLAESARRVELPAGARAFEIGAACEHYLMVAAGRVRVQLLSESGREIVLYRVAGGETCVLTTACLLGHERYAADAIAETDVTALIVPSDSFERLLVESKPFRDFVFMAHAARITSLMVLVEEVAFGQIDVRLARRLLERSEPSGTLPLTHHALAAELGTAREVVSRRLKEFERRSWIRLERGNIEIRDPEGLAQLASGAR
jgi:CRP/FNR family transcriptional regulator